MSRDPFTSTPDPNLWPVLPSADWQDSLATLHLWTQIVGKLRMGGSPWINHSWSVPLYVTSRGLGTGPIPYGGRLFEIDFDFIDHTLPIRASDPDAALLSFLQSTYEAAADLLAWDRAALERPAGYHPLG